jgi:hypothetical protein
MEDLHDVAKWITEDVISPHRDWERDPDGHGVLTKDARGEVARNAAPKLGDIVLEYLDKRGIKSGSVVDANTYRTIELLIAEAMVTQFDYDDKLNSELLDPSAQPPSWPVAAFAKPAS